MEQMTDIEALLRAANLVSHVALKRHDEKLHAVAALLVLEAETVQRSQATVTEVAEA